MFRAKQLHHHSEDSKHCTSVLTRTKYGYSSDMEKYHPKTKTSATKQYQSPGLFIFTNNSLLSLRRNAPLRMVKV